MRIKLVFLAGSLAAFVVAIFFGADQCAKIGKTQQQVTVEAGEEASEDLQVPNPTEGGVQNVNQNLREMKSGMQEQMNQRRDSLDRRIERSGSGE
jgi:hypothetical protein